MAISITFHIVIVHLTSTKLPVPCDTEIITDVTLSFLIVESVVTANISSLQHIRKYCTTDDKFYTILILYSLMQSGTVLDIISNPPGPTKLDIHVFIWLKPLPQRHWVRSGMF